MRRALPLFALLALLSALGCATREWVQTRPEPESYPFKSAHKICDSWGREYAQTKPRSPFEGWTVPNEKRIDWGIYLGYYRRCMEHYGWVQQVQPEAQAPAEAPDPTAP